MQTLIGYLYNIFYWFVQFNIQDFSCLLPNYNLTLLTCTSVSVIDPN